MASTTTNDFTAGGNFYLDPNQQDLLLAALASNTQENADFFATNDMNTFASNGLPAQSFDYSTAPVDTSFFNPVSKSTPMPAMNGAELGLEESPFVDNFDGDTSFDFDNADSSGIMIGALPGDSPESAEKRKIPDDEDDEDSETRGKRREGDEKQAKKPGRKPLTSEPTTKRKAQNRAAQRAFRERKEKHLKDLETKVDELEKASDATNNENALLRAQVQRLQVELREYRKRMSLSSGTNRSSVIGGYGSVFGSNTSNNTFQFDFPRFGGLPGSQLLDSGPLSKTSMASSALSSSASPVAAVARQNSQPYSPNSQPAASMVSSPEQIVPTPPVQNASRTGSINGSVASKSNSISTESSTAAGRIFKFNSGSSSHSSPSDSSVSALGQSSSCGTSPEPCQASPRNGEASLDSFTTPLNVGGSPQVSAPLPSGLDFFTMQNGGQFDPALFGEYRDTQNAIVGDGDFTGGFFNEAFPITDFGTPFHFGDTPAVQKTNPLEDIERIQNADDGPITKQDASEMLNCHKIWDKLANRADFKDGSIDIDSLCSELRAKARCSEAGVVVDHKDVEAALQRLPSDQK